MYRKITKYAFLFFYVKESDHKFLKTRDFGIVSKE